MYSEFDLGVSRNARSLTTQGVSGGVGVGDNTQWRLYSFVAAVEEESIVAVVST